ncbi:hypothetical protein BFP97_09245 [Roseivirga sp. 4D4]|uniref:alanine racemase n=1 Tax=Roseivirga sp. 4D4 TaxID=1889784 RepID=UPI000853969F|nr:alanine racemase [Roseivirga sp. 4D4]OEK01689.1 hypothetical protein BFP97_09245 [Roseivirga sp. 4D4]
MIEKITRPTLLLDTQKMEANINFMVEKADRLNVKLIPHFKTHQSKQIARFFSDRGIDAITVSSVEMAEYFVESGWRDITVAFPFNRLEVEVINGFVQQGVKVKLLVTDVDTVSFLRENLVGQVSLFIELDAGYNRSGVSTERIDEVQAIALEMDKSEKTHFYGLYCHPGNTYHSDSIEGIKILWADAIKKVNAVREALSSFGRELIVRMGDTPGCAVVDDMDGVDEMGPGNFVFYDLVMNYLNVCDESDIAVAVACPIVAKSEARNELVIHGGAVHFSKDHLFDKGENRFFGEMVVLNEAGWSNIIPNAKLISLSQEHGIIKVSDELLETLQVGDVIGILPIHSCLTANLMREYLTLEGQRFDHM